jgi:hypothetical protein
MFRRVLEDRDYAETLLAQGVDLLPKIGNAPCGIYPGIFHW